MSEVSDTIQLIVISGKVMFLAGNLSLKAAILTAKTLDTIYLAKWKGSVSYARLRKIKGDEVQFLNVSTEEKKILHAIEKEMKQHGILYARLPDLCGGDNRTQYVISPSDMVKCRAFLLDHFSGKYGKIKAGPIRPADYIQTGSGEAEAASPMPCRTSSQSPQTENQKETQVDSSRKICRGSGSFCRKRREKYWCSAIGS